MKYDKLVRDNVPEEIARKGKKVTTHVADDREYAKKLDEKLQEEVGEFLFTRKEEDLVDIFEVLDAIVEFRHLDQEKIASIKRKKSVAAGQFRKRIILDEIV